MLACIIEQVLVLCIEILDVSNYRIFSVRLLPIKLFLETEEVIVTCSISEKHSNGPKLTCEVYHSKTQKYDKEVEKLCSS